MKVGPTIPFISYTYASQAAQFARKGEPGFEHCVETAPAYDVTGERFEQEIDCLLWRNRFGDLVGILYHYNTTAYEVTGELLEREGNVNVMVRQDSQRQGIATLLMREATKRFNIDFDQQEYTPEGWAFIDAWRSRT